jgi:CheY-like chemotaxis protein
MLRTVLEGAGCRVGEAANGREALDLLSSVNFGVMILDLNMKVMDGLSVLEEMKARPMANPPRVIVLTAYDSIPAAVKATRLGALDFLEKPASPKEVREAVAAVLREPQRASPQPVEPDTSGGYQAVLGRVREALRASDIEGAESLLMKAADLAQNDAAYFNLLGVIYESRRQWRLAQKFYGKAIRADRKYDPAQCNMRRMYELNTFGRSAEPVALGDEQARRSSALQELLREAKRREH